MTKIAAHGNDIDFGGWQGQLDGKGFRAAILVSRFNAVISSQLLEGAKQALLKNGVSSKDCEVFSVPGALELPVLAMRLAKSKRYDVLVALGTVIKGETAHFESVCRESQAGLMRVSLKTGIPIGFGVLTTYNEEQARARSGGTHGNKGEEAALAALEMANLLKGIKKD